VGVQRKGSGLPMVKGGGGGTDDGEDLPQSRGQQFCRKEEGDPNRRERVEGKGPGADRKSLSRLLGGGASKGPEVQHGRGEEAPCAEGARERKKSWINGGEESPLHSSVRKTRLKDDREIGNGPRLPEETLGLLGRGKTFLRGGA